MTTRYLKHPVTLFALLFLMLVFFQNCSPFSAGNQLNFSSSSSTSGDPSAPGSSNSPTSPGWHTLKVGAGGWLVGLDIAPDGTKVVRADTYGAYIWDAQTNLWRQLVTQSSMPQDTNGPASHGGVFEIRIAPSLTRRMYMALDGLVYRTDDGGKSWLHTAFASVYMGANDSYRQGGFKMAIDPINPDVVYVGTQKNGLFVSSDAGATFSAVSSVPVPLQKNGENFGINGLAFDASQGSVGGKTKRIYAPSFGNGIYVSSDAGATWSRTSGGPTSAYHAEVDSAGTYFVVDADGPAENFWAYKDGAWRNITTGNARTDGYTTIAIDSSRPGRMLIFQGSAINQSFDYGQTWSGIWPTSGDYGKKVATDIPSLAVTPGNEIFSGNSEFDPVTHQIFMSGGVGVWHTLIADTQSTYSWISQSAGIEQLVAINIVVPPGGAPLVLSADRAVYKITDLAQYPSTYGPIGNFCAGWGLDYASSAPNFIAGVFNNAYETDHSSTSTDGGATWTRFGSVPTPLQGVGNQGGAIAASTPLNMVMATANNTIPSYTKDGGQTWTPVTIPGQQGTDGFGWNWYFYFRNQVVAADRVLPNTFYLYSYKLGMFKSTDGGTTWGLQRPGEIGTFTSYSTKIKAVPGQAGHLFFTAGAQGSATHPTNTPLFRSADGGVTFNPIPNVLEVTDFGFGKPAPGSSNPSIFVVGYVNGIYGVYRSDDDANTWINLGDRPVGSLDRIVTLEADPNIYGRVYVGFSGSGYAYYSL